ncbi:hypothetical protein PI125_g22553 [Phytophthora idaei]|nr:hypothetical protein PI125_g22553 [Phytophthora idaei]
MSAVNSPKPEYERPPHSQDIMQLDPTPEPSTNYVSSDQPTQALSSDGDQSNSTTFNKLVSLLCCSRRR